MVTTTFSNLAPVLMRVSESHMSKTFQSSTNLNTNHNNTIHNNTTHSNATPGAIQAKPRTIPVFVVNVVFVV